MNARCLVVDAGHTRVKFAVCRQDSGRSLPEIVDSYAVIYGEPIDWHRIITSLNETPTDSTESCSTLLMGTNLERVKEIAAMWSPLLPTPTIFTDKLSLPIKIDVDFPEKVGIDRLLNGVAANLLRAPNQPAITVGSGTAITIDVIDAKGTFRGGAILPGILLGAKSLHLETTTLPLVNVWELLKTEPAVVGRNTEAAIASGLYWGHLGSIRELVTRSTEWLHNDSPIEPLLLLTGGASGIIAPYLPNSQRIEELPIRGLAAVAKQVVSK